MRDIIFAVVMLSMPAAVAVIAGRTLFAVEAQMGEARLVAETATTGREIYESRCAECHGDLARGTAHAPGLVGVETGTSLARDAMRTVIRNGVAEPDGPYAPMASFRDLSDPEIGAVIRYLRETDRDGAG